MLKFETPHGRGGSFSMKISRHTEIPLFKKDIHAAREVLGLASKQGLTLASIQELKDTFLKQCFDAEKF